MKGIDILRRFGGGNSDGGGATGAIVLADAAVLGTSWAQWQIGGDGFTYIKDRSSPSRRNGPWINPQVGMNHFEVMAHIAGGMTPPGTFDTWLPMTDTVYTWGWAAISDGTHKGSTITIELRDAVSHTVVGTATVVLNIDTSL